METPDTNTDPGSADNQSGEGSRSQTDSASPSVEFTSLPEVVWVRVMLFLPLSDRYHMTMACALFHQLFFHPTLWSRVQLSCFLWWSGLPGSDRVLTLKPSHKKIAAQFGHLFRHVMLHMSHAMGLVEEETGHILVHLAQQSNLRGLTFSTDFASQAGRSWTSQYQSQSSRQPSGQKAVVSMLKEARGLHYLDVSRWPVFSTEESAGVIEKPKEVGDVLIALRDPETCPGLRTLNVAVRVLGMGSRQEQRLLPPAGLNLVATFPHLQHLHVRQSVLSDLLLQGLASGNRCALRTLTVVDCDALPDHSDDVLTAELNGSSWCVLTSACPYLEVHSLAEVTHAPRLTWAMTPYVPLVSVQLLFCSLPPEVLLGLRHCRVTLQSLCCHVLPGQGHDLPLFELVLTCERLKHLVFYGTVRSDTILHLAALPRQWRTFRFRLKHIVLEEPQKKDDGPSRVEGEGKENLHWRRKDLLMKEDSQEQGDWGEEMERSGGAEEEGKGQGKRGRGRERKLAWLCREVSKRLGYPWRPCEP